jgi:hypothetical protein
MCDCEGVGVWHVGERDRPRGDATATSALSMRGVQKLASIESGVCVNRFGCDDDTLRRLRWENWPPPRVGDDFRQRKTRADVCGGLCADVGERSEKKHVL